MYHFIVNPGSRAGKAKKIWAELEAELESREVAYKTYMTEYDGHATKLAEMICDEYDGVKKIVVVGGDGTINEVINGLHPYEEILLGYIPLGSGNDLARGLGLSLDPMENLNRVLSPKRFQYVDHGILNCYDGTAPRRFAISSGIGFDAAVCDAVQKSKVKKILNKIGLGNLVYYIIAIQQIIAIKPVNAEILIDGTRKRRVEDVVFIASMIQKSEGGGLRMAPKADNADGKLSVCMVHGLSRLKVAMVMPLLLFAKHTKVKGIEIFDCTSIEIKTEAPLCVHTDGEVPGTQSHIRVACLPERVRMYM